MEFQLPRVAKYRFRAWADLRSWFFLFLSLIDNFPKLFDKVPVAQLVECLTVVLKDTSLFPTQGEFFLT